MLNPDNVLACVRALQANSKAPVTVKCRLGVDNCDSYEELVRFVTIVAQSGVKHFIVHARKAWLEGLDPKENRDVPPLRYKWVYRLALDFPHLDISINGGINDLETALAILRIPRNLPRSDLDRCPMATGRTSAHKIRQAFLKKRGKRSRIPDHVKDEVARIIAQEEAEEAAEAAAQAAAQAVEKAPSAAVTAACGCAAEEGTDAEEKQRQTRRHKAMHADTDYVTPPEWRDTPIGQGLIRSVMMGRAAMNNPWVFADADRVLFNTPNPGLSRREVLMQYAEYCDEAKVGGGVPFACLGCAVK